MSVRTKQPDEASAKGMLVGQCPSCSTHVEVPVGSPDVAMGGPWRTQNIVGAGNVYPECVCPVCSHRYIRLEEVI